jgi:general secretion pathway protein G
LDKARIARSIAEIRHIEKSIKVYSITNEKYPLTLAEAGVANILDPWGTPYQYLNVTTIATAAQPQGKAVTDDFNAWSWLMPSSAYATPSPNRGQGNGGGNSGSNGNRGQGNQHGGQGGSQSTSAAVYGAGQPTNAGGSASSQPSNAGGDGGGSNNGNASAGVGIRKDRFGAPLNTDFDLYSMGRNRESADLLSTPKSYDDIIRASDGGFVGLASDF